MIFTPNGNLGYEALNSFLCFCRYCSVGDFVGPTSCSDTLYTNGSVEGRSVEVTTTDAVEQSVNIVLCLSSHDGGLFLVLIRTFFL